MKSSASLTDEQFTFRRNPGLDLLRGQLDGGVLEPAALRELLAHRRESEFVPADGMDRRLTRVIAAKRRSRGTPS